MDGLRKLFSSINQDSSKNQYIIDKSESDKIRIEQFKKILNTNYSQYFAKKSSNKKKNYSIDEFIKKMVDIFNNDTNDDDPQILIDTIIKANHEFYEINRYQVDFEVNKDCFYVDELKLIENKIIFSMKNNNFIKWYFDRNEKPYHNQKKNRKRISLIQANKVWANEFVELTEARCPLPNCSNIICKEKRGVVQSGVKDLSVWHVGHIKSFSNGGSNDLINLRPICMKCNLDMGDMNWDEYENSI